MCLKYCKNTWIKLKDKKILLRNPRLSDAKSLLELINSLVDEDAQISTNKKFTLKEEREWLENKIKLIRENNIHYLVAFDNGEAVSSIEFEKKMWRKSHTAEIIGVSVKKGYRGIGLGTAMMKHAVKILSQYFKVRLLSIKVFATNKPAIGLYKKVGFRKVAKLPKRFLYKGRYVDEFIMDYLLKKI